MYNKYIKCDFDDVSFFSENWFYNKITVSN